MILFLIVYFFQLTQTDNAFLHSPEAPPTNRTGWYPGNTTVLCESTVTVFEQVGPSILLTMMCLISAMFVSSAALLGVLNNNRFERYIIDTLGGFACPAELRYKNPDGTIEFMTVTVGALLCQILDASQLDPVRYRSLRRCHKISSVIAAIPYGLIPFYSRWSKGCAVFWHWNSRVNYTMYTSNIVSVILAACKFYVIIILHCFVFRCHVLHCFVTLL